MEIEITNDSSKLELEMVIHGVKQVLIINW